MSRVCKKIIVIGAPAFIDLHTLIRDINSSGKDKFEVIALLDDNPELHGTEICGVPVVGPLSLAREYPDDVCFALCVNNVKRRVQRIEIVRDLGIPEHRYPPLVHPSCCIGDYASVGFGTQMLPFSSVKNSSSVGNFCFLSESFVTSTHVSVSDGCLCGGCVHFLDSSVIEPCVFVGTGAVVAEDVTLGAGCFVGAQSLITKNVHPGFFALGNPAKQIPNITLPEWLRNSSNVKL